MIFDHAKFSRDVDFSVNQQLTPEYRKISPLSTVPALVDGDFKLFDSSAMAIYLVEKYATDDKLYPKDPVKRAKVNEGLFFVSSAMFPVMLQAFKPVYFGIATEINPECLTRFRQLNEVIEGMLGDDYWTGAEMTLADIFLWSVVESWNRLDPMDAKKLPKFAKWIEKMRQHPCSEYQQVGGQEHIDFIRELMEENTKNLNAE